MRSPLLDVEFASLNPQQAENSQCIGHLHWPAAAHTTGHEASSSVLTKTAVAAGVGATAAPAPAAAAILLTLDICFMLRSSNSTVAL